MATAPENKDQSPRRYLLTRSDIEAMTPTDKIHLLNPNGKRGNRSRGDATGLADFGFHYVENPTGADSTEYYVHHHSKIGVK